MSDDLHRLTRDLIKEVEKRDKLFRIAQTLFNILIILLLIVSMYYGYRVLQQDEKSREKAVQEILERLNQP